MRCQSPALKQLTHQRENKACGGLGGSFSRRQGGQGEPVNRVASEQKPEGLREWVLQEQGRMRQEQTTGPAELVPGVCGGGRSWEEERQGGWADRGLTLHETGSYQGLRAEVEWVKL